MKQQIARLSPHQNGKVFAVLLALTSCAFVLPFGIFIGLATDDPNVPSLWLLLLFPILYLTGGYIGVAVGCWIYNTLFKVVGGIEFETEIEA